jgi:CRP/FNR family cyclic AMP-dependent transcriptional regulator
MLFQREVCRLLDEDPELATGVPVAERQIAGRVCEARVLTLPAGPWHPNHHERRNGDIGFLVLGGVLARRLIADSRPACELLGEGDLIRPWGRAHGEAPEGETITWSVITETELAVLDARLADRMRRWPRIGEALIERCATRADTLARHLAILSAHPVERRLLLVLWHLAQRWGRVSPGGVRIPLPLTHGLLAEMIGVRRPSLSTAVGHLVDDGLLERPQGRGGWLLTGAAPGPDAELGELGEDAIPAYASHGTASGAPRSHRFSQLVRSVESPAD